MNVHELIKNPAPDPDGSVTLVEFLETVPPQSKRAIKRLHSLYSSPSFGPEIVAHVPGEIRLHCSSDVCKRTMTFVAQEQRIRFGTKPDVEEEILEYRCKHCESRKVFAVRFMPTNYPHGDAIKLGELPQFGPPLPSKLLDVFTDARDHLLKGRQCENAGLGVGALAYYRRVVEQQKDSLFDALIAALETFPNATDLLESLRAAKQQTQFQSAMGVVKGTWPSSLLIHGQDPLSLLHDGMSAGLHNFSDEECLSLATSFRKVLTHLAEELSAAVHRQRDFADAVATLQAAKKPKPA